MLPRYYEDPKTLHVHTEPERAYYIPFDTLEGALADDREKSPRLTMLSGEWSFGYYGSVRLLPRDLFAPSVTPDTIPVPSVWQMHGYDRHQYTNIRYPFPYDPPHVPADDPCGVYSRELTLTPRADRKYYINFEGVDSCFYLWVNRAFAGYSQVSHSTSEFDITDLLAPGVNTFTVVVLKWCDGSYLEDQDKLRMSGIFRDVYILERDACHIRDYFVRTAITGKQVRVTCDIALSGGVKDVAWSLLDAEGACLRRGVSKDGKLAMVLSDAHRWNAEDPYLYSLVLRCGDEVIMEPVGVREITVKKGVLYLNGQNIKFHGMNRHDSDPVKGPAVTLEDMKKDLRLMREFNITAIRTSHYPNSLLFTRLCDRYGFYVIGESDVESHGTALAREKDGVAPRDLLAEDPDYAEAILDRVRRNVERDKNRPSVVIWSMGNESGYGENFRRAIEWTQNRDETRLTHYEQADDKDMPPRSVYSEMYTNVRRMEETLAGGKLTHPWVLCEFTHAMGNGPGDCEDYWQLFRAHDELCGGFVWEWCDHSVYMGRTADNRDKYYYGGDWGEFPHDGNFCMDGMVYPDRTPHTGLYEYKNVLRPVRFTAVDIAQGVFVAHNYLDFTNARDELRAECVIKQSGVEMARFGLDEELLDIPPHGERELRIAYPVPVKGDFAVFFELTKKNDSALVKAGHVLGREECGRHTYVRAGHPAPASRAAIREEDGRAVIEGASFRYVYDGNAAAFSEMVYGGRRLIEKPVQWNVWRAPTDNDRQVRVIWEENGFDRAVTRGYETVCREEDGKAVITTRFSMGAVYLPRILTATAVWTVDGDGRVALKVTADQAEGKVLHPVTDWGREAMDNTVPFLPRFGLRLFLNRNVKDVRYFGYGPFESYIDKHRADVKDLFDTTVAKMYEPYIKPQENGSRYDVSYLRLASREGGLEVTGDSFCFNAGEYTQEELTAKAHSFELEKSGYTVLCLDAGMSGVGSNSCGPVLMRKYQLRDRVSLEVSIEPF